MALLAVAAVVALVVIGLPVHAAYVDVATSTTAVQSASVAERDAAIEGDRAGRPPPPTGPSHEPVERPIRVRPSVGALPGRDRQGTELREARGGDVSPEAGWYADPTDPSAVRWWDGAQWTTQTRPAPRELALAGAVASGPGGPVSATDTATSARSGPRHAAPADRSGPIVASAPPVPAPAPATAPSPAADAGPDVVDRSRPGARAAALAPPPASTPGDDGDAVDRSRPGARRPVVLPPKPAELPAATPFTPAAAPTGFVPSVPSPATAGPGFGAPSVGFGASSVGFGASSFGAAPAGFGHDSGPVHTGVYVAPRSWRKPVAVVVVLLLVLGGLAAYGVPKYLATRAQAVAAQQPDVLVRSAPKALAGQKKFTVAGMDTTAIASSITGAGATWAWVQPYGSRNSVTVYMASDVPLPEQPTAVRALTSRDAATELLATVSAGLSNGANGKLVTGTPAEYASPVTGKTWCMPVTVSGVQGGYCLWTSGKELLQTLSLPGLQEVAAKSTLDALAQMAKIVTKAATGSVPVASAAS